MIKEFRSKLLYVFILLSVGACEGLLDDDIVEEGSYMFWSNFDGPPIDIYIEGDFAGTITGYYSTVPECGSSGCVTVTLEPGTYEIFAVEQTNNGATPREWNDFFTVRPNACGKKGLSK